MEIHLPLIRERANKSIPPGKPAKLDSKKRHLDFESSLGYKTLSEGFKKVNRRDPLCLSYLLAQKHLPVAQVVNLEMMVLLVAHLLLAILG